MNFYGRIQNRIRTIDWIWIRPKRFESNWIRIRNTEFIFTTPRKKPGYADMRIYERIVKVYSESLQIYSFLSGEK